jgi:hypothetical protein
MGACLSLRNAHPLRKWRASSIPCKTNWTRSGNEPVERSKSHKNKPILPHKIVSVASAHGACASKCVQRKHRSAPFRGSIAQIVSARSIWRCSLTKPY